MNLRPITKTADPNGERLDPFHQAAQDYRVKHSLAKACPNYNLWLLEEEHTRIPLGGGLIDGRLFEVDAKELITILQDLFTALREGDFEKLREILKEKDASRIAIMQAKIQDQKGQTVENLVGRADPKIQRLFADVADEERKKN